MLPAWMRQAVDGFVNAAVYAKREAVAGGVDIVHQAINLVTLKTNNVQNWAKNLTGQALGAINFDNRRGNEVAV